MFRRVRQFWRTLPSWITGPPRALWRLAIGTRPERHVERAFLALFIGAIALALLCAALILSGLYKPFGGDLGEGFRLVSSRTTPKELAEILRNLSFFAAGVVGALFGFFQLHNAARRTRISDDQALVAFEAERNDRFVKAAELLKDESPAIRMAAIAAFQRLAEEDRAHYRRTVIRVLAGFVRAETGPLSDPRLEALSSPGDRNADPRPTEPVVEALKSLSALTGYGARFRKTKLGWLVDLKECDLRGLVQPGGRFVGWQLDGAHFGKAFLTDVDFSDASLNGANFDGAVLRSAIFTDAYLNRAKFRKSDLEEANFSEAKLMRACFEGASLHYAILDAAELHRADMTKVDLTKVRNIQTTQLAGALNVTWPDHIPRPESGPYSIDPDDPEADTSN